MSILYQFPYGDVDKDERVILYGGGKIGQSFTQQIYNNAFCNIVAISDINYEKMGDIFGVNVISPNQIFEYNFDKIIVAVQSGKEDIVRELEKIGIEHGKIISCEYSKFSDETVESGVIRTVFDILGIRNPSYIDAGACHPHVRSNTMTFYENGSRGINIEANVALKDEFEKYRPEDINLFVGLADTPGEMMFYRADTPDLNTLSIDSIQWYQKQFNAKYDSGIKIKVTTLNDIVNDYCSGIFPDFLDIDIEGMDEVVLESVDFSKSSPLLICTECPISVANKILMDKECEGGGYVPYSRVTCNTIYLRKDIYRKVLPI